MSLEDKLKTSSISLYELMVLCKSYDSTNGCYPESEYEGLEVFEFIIDKSLLTGIFNDELISFYNK